MRTEWPSLNALSLSLSLMGEGTSVARQMKDRVARASLKLSALVSLSLTHTHTHAHTHTVDLTGAGTGVARHMQGRMARATSSPRARPPQPLHLQPCSPHTLRQMKDRMARAALKLSALVEDGDEVPPVSIGRHGRADHSGPV